MTPFPSHHANAQVQSQNGMVEEEKFLALEQENRRLKKEAVERDVKFKQTVARLARAEEAAKRATIALSSKRATGGGTPGGPTSSRLFSAEQKVAELEEEARDLTRKLTREHERGLHFKNLCKEYKAKLDDALRAARARPPPVQSRASTTPKRQEAPSFSKRRASEDGATAEALRLERVRTASLAAERDELRRLLHAAGGKVPGMKAGGASVSAGTDGEWVLEHFVSNGTPYLLDRQTLKVYSKPATAKDWPSPVGRLVNGQLHAPPQADDLFKALDSYLKRERVHLKEAFDSFDANDSGVLSASELGRFLQAVMGGAKPSQQKYFQAMLDINGDGKVTYPEMVESLKQCILIGQKASAAGASAELSDLVKKVKDYISSKNTTVAVVFAHFDKDRDGKLDQNELLAMFTKLVPRLTTQDKRFLLAHVTKLDMDGDGKISLAELRQALRAVKIAFASAPGTPSTNSVTFARPMATNAAAPEQLVLTEQIVQGGTYLVDKKTNYVYNALSSPNEVLRPLGKLAGGVVTRPPTSADLVGTMDATLKREQARLKDIFDAHDGSKTGSLTMTELESMLQKLIVGASSADVHFFRTLVDANSDGRVAYPELVACIKDIISASQATAERANMDVERALQEFKNVVRGNQRDVRAGFGGGALSYPRLLDLVKRFTPNASAQARRYVITFLRQLDLDNRGSVAYEDMAHALRVLDVHVVAADGVSPSQGVPQPRQGAADEWYLEETLLNGHSYLIDRHTMRVYTHATGKLPKLAGRMQGGRLVPFERSQEDRFIQGLDGYLKTQQKRLKDVFDTFDRDKQGSLNRAEVTNILRAILPDASAGDVQYFRMLLDLNGDGEVSFAEFCDGVKEAIAEAKHAAPNESEMSAVLKTIKQKLAIGGVNLSVAFGKHDKGRTGYISHHEALSMLRSLVPSLTTSHLRQLVHHLRAADAENVGRVTLPELFQILGMSKIKRVATPSGPSNAVAVMTPGSYGGGGGDPAELANLREAASEVAYLRQQLRDSKALCDELEASLKRERETNVPQYPFPSGGDGNETSYTASELHGEIKSAWERAGVLQKRYHEAQTALGTMKSNHTRVLQQLDDTHKRLNAERKENLKLSAEEKRLAMELETAREIEPMLEQARKERLALEKENHSLLAAAMNAPSEAQSEARRLRSLMVEAQRERAAAELREADLKRTLASLGGGGLEDAKLTKMDRDRLRVDLSRMEVELEAANDKIRIFMEMGNANRLMDAAKGSAVVVADDKLDEGSLRAELRGLRETYSDQVEEMHKAQKMLRLEEAQVADLRVALAEEKARADKLNEDLYRRVQAHEAELERRQKKIHKLEAQLRRVLSGGSVADEPAPQTMRASVNGLKNISKADEEDMDDLALGENIFELRLLGVDIEKDAVDEANPATFMTVDFFEHETQATAVQNGLNVTVDHTLQYIVKADAFFLEYLDTKHLPVELNKSLGMDFATLGVARVNLKRVLDDARAGHDPKQPPVHFCDVVGRSGEIIARLRYAAFMRKSIHAALKEYSMRPALPQVVDASDPIAAAFAAARNASSRTPSTLMKIELSCCRELVPRTGEPGAMVPYCSYTFPGLAGHDTIYGRGSNPDFNDVHEFPLVRTTDLETRLERSAMEVIAFDDADMDLEGAGVIGIARVDLGPLAKGLPVQGAYPLFSQTREKRGTVYVSVSWKDPSHDPSTTSKYELPPPARGAAAVSAPYVGTRGEFDIEEDRGAIGKVTPSSPASTSLARLGTGGKPGSRRYDDSVDAPGWKEQTSVAGGGRAADAAGARDNVVVSIGQLELGSALFHDHRVRQMFMLFEFMPKFHRDDQQQTKPVKKTGQVLDFAYTRAFSTKDAGLRKALASVLRGHNEDESTIPFCLVSDDNGIDFEDIGFCEVKLADLLEGDLLDKRVEVLDKNNVAIGHVTLSVVASAALKSIMKD